MCKTLKLKRHNGRINATIKHGLASKTNGMAHTHAHAHTHTHTHTQTTGKRVTVLTIGVDNVNDKT